MSNLRKPVTRTVVFADIVGSTGLYKTLGDTVAARLVTSTTEAIANAVHAAGGEVVKTLGDGLLAVFDANEPAVRACCEAQRMLAARAQRNQTAVELKVGLSRGPVVLTPGDCFGDAVNAAARLSDSAAGGQILLGDAVTEGLGLELTARLLSLGAIFLRGYDVPVPVHRIEWDASWQTNQTMPHAPTQLGASIASIRLRLRWLDLVVDFSVEQTPVGLGRSPSAEFSVNDLRVSRQHARVDWHGSYFMLLDLSSNGTWVRFAGQDNVLALRRSECALHGSGEICLGAKPTDPTAPTVQFSLQP